MQLNLTKDQVRTLVECLYLTEWVANGWNDLEDIQFRSDVAELEQLVFAKAQKDNPDYLSPDEGDGIYPTIELEEGSRVRKALDLYEDNIFWEELIERLAEREVIRETGAASWDGMSPRQRIELIEPHSIRIRDALRRHGIGALVVTTSEPNG